MTMWLVMDNFILFIEMKIWKFIRIKDPYCNINLLFENMVIFIVRGTTLSLG